MVKKTNGQTKTIALVLGLIIMMLFIVLEMPTTITEAATDSSGDRYENPNDVEIFIPDQPSDPQPDPYAESKKAAEEQVQAIEAEGAKIENRSVDGVKSAASGLYLANKVKGVAVTPSTSNEGGSALYVQTCDVNTSKSTGAMASIQSAAAIIGGTITHMDGTVENWPTEVGPVVDVYFKKTQNGQVVPGTAKDVDNIKIGIPDSFKKPGYNYGYVVVFPGGKTFEGRLSGNGDAKFVDINMVHDTYNDPVDYSQATIALVRYPSLEEYNRTHPLD